MTSQYKTALIIGGSRGTGRSLSLKLVSSGIKTIAVARNPANLDKLKAEAPEIETIAIDAAADGAAQELFAKTKPDLLVITSGVTPSMGSLSELSWEEFSQAWNIDTKIAFEFTKAALLAPMQPGGTIISFASGAALGGSPLSGGYAGAKRMQHFVSNYGKWEADRRELGLNFYTFYPKQFIAGTNIANDAASAYAGARSISSEQVMNQWEKPLTPDLIASYVDDVLSTDAMKPGAYGFTGTGIEAMA